MASGLAWFGVKHRQQVMFDVRVFSTVVLKVHIAYVAM